jgi:hypothetical protein
MQTGDPEQPKPLLPLTTRELLAAILLCSERHTYKESELTDQVEQLRLKFPGYRPFSRQTVHDHLRTFVVGQVLRYAGASDTFFFDRRNVGYLQNILAASLDRTDLQSLLNGMVIAVSPLANNRMRTVEART